MFFAFGRIWRMLVDIEPVMIENSGMDGVTLKGDRKASEGVWGPPRVKQDATEETTEEQTEEESKPSIYETYDLDE